MPFPKYVDFYRHYGIRRPMQMVGPPLAPLSKLVLPREAVLHYLPEGASLGISSDDPLVSKFIGNIFVDHVIQLTDKRGTPRSSMLSYSKMIREYHRRYRRFRQLTDIAKGLRDPRNLVVENYALLGQLYRYMPNVYRPYNRWWNVTKTFVDHVDNIAQLSNRQQFLECHLPTMLPSRSMLSKGQVKLTPRLLSLFPDQESLFLLELWKWLGEMRGNSIFHQWSTDTLSKMNLVWKAGDRFFVMNMGNLNDWRLPARGETDSRSPNSLKDRSLAPQALQNRFLRLLMFLQESSVSPGSEPQPLEDDTIHDETQAENVAEAKPVEIEIPPHDDEEEPTKLKLTIDMDLKGLPLDEIEETPENIQLIDKLISKDLDALDQLHAEREAAMLQELKEEDELIEKELNQRAVDREDEEPVDKIPLVTRDLNLTEAIRSKADQYASQDMLSAAEYRRLMALSEAYTKLPNPFGEKGTLVEAVKIHKDDLTVDATRLVPHLAGVPDHSMLHSTLADLDHKYVRNVLHKDIGRAVLHIQKGGVAVTGYQVEETRDAINHYHRHSVQLTPIKGRAATIHFRVPVVNADGTYTANGVKYRLSRQWGDIPIRKVNPSTVALTSYYGKTFVTRSEKKVSSWADWLVKEIKVRGMDMADDSITEMMLANVYDPNQRVPRIYSTLASNFRSFYMGDRHFFFDYDSRVGLINEDLLKKVEQRGMLLCGTIGAKKDPMVVGSDNVFYRAKVTADGKDVDLEPLGQMEDLVGLDSAKAPREIAEIKIGGKLIPVGIFLSFTLGFQGLLKLLGVSPNRTLLQGEQARLAPDEYMITFEDERLVFNRSSDKIGLILQGIATYNEVLANYAAYHYEKRAIYYNVMERLRLGVRAIREMELMVDMFIDPITKEILDDRHEPDTFVGLLLMACDLLTTDWSPDEVDTEYQRLRGYERFAGAVYGQLVKAVRQHRSRASSQAPLEVHPNAVWNAIANDSAVRLVEESNPVHELKGVEEVTYAGTGGRSGRSMVGHTRLFHPNDLGIISEATKDSGDVAITTYTTANPQVTNLRGMTKRYSRKDTGPSSLLSTSALLAPCSTFDDPRRTGFISIQNSSTTHVKHQRPSPTRTGYEKVIAHRTSDLYASAAKSDGKVTKVNKYAIEVTNKDGSVTAFEVGRRFGNVSGIVVPHEIVPNVKVGDAVKKGDIVSYNEFFFEPDPLDPKQVLWKQGVLLNTALMEAPETLEDSSAVSLRAAKLLETQLTKVRDIVVSKDQAVHDLVSVGDKVEVDSILCTLEDPITADTALYDESSMDTLRLLSSNNPKAKISGTVEKVEVFYNVPDVEDLSPSLQEIIRYSDMERKRRAKETRTEYTSGKVNEDMKIEGKSLQLGEVDIRVYVTVDVPNASGDKVVVGNQLKSVVGRVLEGVNETVSGFPIDLIFSYQGIDARIVQSPILMGTTNTLQAVLSRKAAAIYRGENHDHVK